MQAGIGINVQQGSCRFEHGRCHCVMELAAKMNQSFSLLQISIILCATNLVEPLLVSFCLGSSCCGVGGMCFYS